MKKIYKYSLAVTDVQKLKIQTLDGVSSFKDQLIMVGVQKDKPYMWCMVDDTLPSRAIVIYTVGTGHPVPEVSKQEYLGSYMILNESLVFHVFLGSEIN